MILTHLPYVRVDPADVAPDQWPFVEHLNFLARRVVYHRRALRLAKWTETDFEREHKRLASTEAGREALAAARTIKLRTLETGNRVVETGLERLLPEKGAIDVAVMEYVLGFFRLSAAIERSLWSALRCFAPELVADRVKLCKAAIEPDGWHVVDSMVFDGKSDTSTDSPVAAYLAHVSDIQQSLTTLDTWLELLKDGSVAVLWRNHEQREGARRAGKQSGIARKSASRVNEHVVQEAAEQLLQQGRNQREVAGILAGKFHVSSDYIRKLLRRATSINRIMRD